MAEELKVLGKSFCVKKMVHFIKKVARTDSNVLLLGETGVGKGLAAKMIHSLRERRDEPFIKINCSNLNENLLESELFGYKKGAYTGAFVDKPGLIEEADGGMFFLDEIADINFYLQAKLLSVIEEKKIKRLGENKSRKIDVQFIVATNKDLSDLVAKGMFRQDLYYRISILRFYIPPLRERKEDIPLLVMHILRKENEKNNKNKMITQEALNKLLDYDYPGNIRELENIIKRAYIFSNDTEIKEEDIEFEIIEKKEKLIITEELFRKIIKEKMSFWEVVHKPFLKRELNKREVKEIISMGLVKSNGCYKKLLPIFNIGSRKRDYKRFMDIIRIHELK